MSSTTTLTTLTEKDVERPSFDVNTLTEKEKKELVAAETVSIVSGTTLSPSESTFHAAKILKINAKGIPVLRLPLPSNELQIDIYNSDDALVYQSIRAKRSSGNCVLQDAEGKKLISTEYFFPRGDPILHIGDEANEEVLNVKTISKWTSRMHTFQLPDGRTFIWDYKREKGFGIEGKKRAALVLTVQGKRVAILIRNDETRTPGSKSCSAGNGGDLLLGDLVGSKDGISEELVIASCLLMLKKELDRRRVVQFMMISSMVTA